MGIKGNKHADFRNSTFFSKQHDPTINTKHYYSRYNRIEGWDSAKLDYDHYSVFKAEISSNWVTNGADSSRF